MCFMLEPHMIDELCRNIQGFDYDERSNYFLSFNYFKMTVKELIEELEKYDDDAIVEIYKNDSYTDDVKNVYESVLTDFYKVIIIQNY